MTCPACLLIGASPRPHNCHMVEGHEGPHSCNCDLEWED